MSRTQIQHNKREWCRETKIEIQKRKRNLKTKTKSKSKSKSKSEIYLPQSPKSCNRHIGHRNHTHLQAPPLQAQTITPGTKATTPCNCDCLSLKISLTECDFKAPKRQKRSFENCRTPTTFSCIYCSISANGTRFLAAYFGQISKT